MSKIYEELKLPKTADKKQSGNSGFSPQVPEEGNHADKLYLRLKDKLPIAPPRKIRQQLKKRMNDVTTQVNRL